VIDWGREIDRPIETSPHTLRPIEGRGLAEQSSVGRWFEPVPRPGVEPVPLQQALLPYQEAL
jgi:hypothetical protein